VFLAVAQGQAQRLRLALLFLLAPLAFTAKTILHFTGTTPIKGLALTRLLHQQGFLHSKRLQQMQQIFKTHQPETGWAALQSQALASTGMHHLLLLEHMAQQAQTPALGVVQALSAFLPVLVVMLSDPWSVVTAPSRAAMMASS
jgi:hypothetical protein